MFETSIFITLFNKFYLFLATVLKNSLIGRAWFGLVRGVKKLAAGSFMVNLFKLPVSKLHFNENSVFYRWMDNVINLIPSLLKRFYKRFEAILSNSLIFKLVMVLAQNLSVLIALFMVVVFVVPHKTAFVEWDNMYSAYAVILFFLLFLIKSMKEKDSRIQVKAVNVFFYVFMLMVIIGQITSFNHSLSLRFLVFYMTCFLLVLMMVSAIRTREQLTTFIEIVLVGVTFCGIYGLYQGIKGVPVIASQIDYTLNEGAPGRIFSSFENPNNFAQILSMMIPFYVGIIFSSKGIKKKIIFILAALPPLASLLLTLSRSSWIGLAVAAFIFLLLTNRKVIPVLILCGLLALPFMPSYIITRIATIFNPKDTSTSYRFDIFKTMWPVIKDYSLHGIGLGNDVVSQIAYNYPIFTTKVPIHCHNVYLQIWAEMGIIGLSSFVLFIANLFKSCVSRVRLLAKDLEMKYFLAAGIASLAGVLVTAIAEYIWFYPRVMLIFWMVVGLVLTGLFITKDSSRAEVSK